MITIRDIDRRLSALEQAGNGDGIPEVVVYSEDGELITGNPEANYQIALTMADCSQRIS
ncbi:MAG: hypothetical protein AWU58_735 [Methanohalophilus sp. T328-1]|nr:MAG: hypothetical protein AWU58_735 [Methanohalophilus sp. T328-1]